MKKYITLLLSCLLLSNAVADENRYWYEDCRVYSLDEVSKLSKTAKNEKVLTSEELKIKGKEFTEKYIKNAECDVKNLTEYKKYLEYRLSVIDSYSDNG
ncbi:TPA: hypothetical protein PC505_001403 [Morganella morganii]|nr:hypothetical protein [Morganella morganii]HDF2362796.1 hypothetical protein [Morganella morganii]HDF2422022.1 hypothetical protein [Morganella morganii]